MISNSVAWIRSNYMWLGPLAVVLTVNIANALLKFPETESFGHKLLDAVSFLARSNSPGTIKMLGKRSENPNKLQS